MSRGLVVSLSVAFVSLATCLFLLFEAYFGVAECPFGTTPAPSGDACLPGCPLGSCRTERVIRAQNRDALHASVAVVFASFFIAFACRVAKKIGRQRLSNALAYVAIVFVVVGCLCVLSGMPESSCARGVLLSETCVLDCDDGCGPVTHRIVRRPVRAPFWIAWSVAASTIVVANAFIFDDAPGAGAGELEKPLLGEHKFISP